MSSSATGIQWYLNGNPIAGATNQNYVATATGSYTAQLNALGCHSAVSDPIVVTVDTMPTTPTVSGTTNGTGTQDQAWPEQPLTLTATSTGAAAYQWYQAGSPIAGQTASTTIATSAATDTVTT